MLSFTCLKSREATSNAILLYTGAIIDCSFPAVNLTLDPEGESADFFGDNVKYFSEYANQGYAGSLEIAMINDDFRTTKKTIF